jgi:LuxR family maltose regulon positive regulatory protein
LQSLLKTKLFVVRPQPRIVRRQQAGRRIDQLPQHRLTLVSAPPGFGKTTLLGAWIQRTSFPTAWVSLDSGDNDPHRFFSYLTEALSMLHPQVGEAARQALQLNRTPQPEAILTSLLNDIATITTPFLLAFDDYHVIEQPAIHEALLFLLEHSPAILHVAITTRVDPPIPLARFRVRGQLLEIRAADLRFSTDEVGEFFNGMMELGLSEANLALLQQKTEGWAAGLHMAALSLHGRQDTDHFIEEFSGADRYILDYLLEEVIRQLPDETQRMIVQLSLLERFCAPLCEAVTGSQNGVELLEQLERANLFLISLDNRRQWYRYHHLFADLLQHRMSGQAQEVSGVHMRAAHWFAEQNLLREAVGHAVSSGDDQTVASIAQHFWTRLPSETTGLLEEVLQVIPPAIIQTRPKLLMLQGWAHAFGYQIESAAESMSLLTALLNETSEAIAAEDLQELQGQMHSLLAVIARESNKAAETIHHAKEAIRLTPERAPGAPGYMWLTTHGLFYVLQGDAHHAEGNVRQAMECFQRGVAYANRTKDYHAMYIALCDRAREQLRLGELAAAMASIDEAEQTINIVPKMLSRATLQYDVQAEICFERGEFQQSKHATESARVMNDNRRPLITIQGNKRLFYISVMQGDWGVAERLIAENESITLPAYSARFVSIIELMRAERDLHRQNHAAVRDWIERFFGEQSGQVPQRNYFMRSLEQLFHIRALIVLGELGKAEAFIEPLLAEFEERGLIPYVLRLLAMRAILHQANGQQERAFDQLGEALRRGAAEGFIAPFAELRDHVGKLLTQHRRAPRRRDGVRESYLNAVCTACGVDAPIAATQQERGDGEIIPLTNRELEILQLMAQGFSNREIGERLYVSMNTIKTHIANLLDKLEAGNRIEAITRARQAGVL